MDREMEEKVADLQQLCSSKYVMGKKGIHVKQLEVVTSLKSKTNPVWQFAVQQNLPLHSWPIQVTPKDYDIGLVVSFGHLIPNHVITSFPLFDLGEVLMQSCCHISPDDTLPELSNRLACLGSELLGQCVKELPQCLDLAKPQPQTGITYAPKVTASTAVVRWRDLNSTQIYNLYRALSGVFPLYTTYQGLPIKLYNGTLPLPVIDNIIRDKRPTPGFVEFHRPSGVLRVMCADGFWVAFQSIGVPRKKPISAADFYNGYLSKTRETAIHGGYSANDGVYLSVVPPLIMSATFRCKEPDFKSPFVMTMLIDKGRGSKSPLALSPRQAVLINKDERTAMNYDELKELLLACHAANEYDLIHERIPHEEKLKNGTTTNLISLSIGLESIEDILEDLDQALVPAVAMSPTTVFVRMAGLGEGFLKQDSSFATRAIHVGQEPEQWESRSVVPPISLSTTFKQDGPCQFKQYEYGRSGNPSRSVLEKCLASLDGAKHALTFSSGLGATTAVVQLLNAGDHIICVDDVYGGTNRLFSTIAARMNIETTFVDATIVDNVKNALRANTKLIWIESPTNPLLKVIDIKAISAIIQKHEDILLVVDNTFLTSYFQRPLELGADIVLYSITKYLNGHSDVIMGSIATNNKEAFDKLKFLQNGLPSHPQHELAKKQSYGHSGMLSFYIKGGLQESQMFFKALKVFTLAESLGGFESLVELPCLMTHASVPYDQRIALGITDSLIRVSVGLEAPEDLIADLDQALKSTLPQPIPGKLITPVNIVVKEHLLNGNALLVDQKIAA
uniref:cystathionine gamma-lyase n=2 Tax=Timema TaxID=61471 RepID=A0A7R9FII7_9NEOP|nr:unnamed protein product [Timema tahoe]